METIGVQEIVNIIANAGVFGAIAILLWKRLTKVTDTYTAKLETQEDRHRTEMRAISQHFWQEQEEQERRIEVLVERNIEILIKVEVLLTNTADMLREYVKITRGTPQT